MGDLYDELMDADTYEILIAMAGVVEGKANRENDERLEMLSELIKTTAELL